MGLTVGEEVQHQQEQGDGRPVVRRRTVKTLPGLGGNYNGRAFVKHSALCDAVYTVPRLAPVQCTRTTAVTLERHRYLVQSYSTVADIRYMLTNVGSNTPLLIVSADSSLVALTE